MNTYERAEKFVPHGTSTEAMLFVVSMVGAYEDFHDKFVALVHGTLLEAGNNPVSDRAGASITEAAVILFAFEAIKEGEPTADEVFDIYNNWDIEVAFDWNDNGWEAEYTRVGECCPFAQIECQKANR